MKLLTDEMLCDNINNQRNPLVQGLDLPVKFDKNSAVQPASVDLHVGPVYLPGTAMGDPGSENDPLIHHSLKPGHTALVRTREILELPSNIAAIGFPPSRVSQQGILMTNPGHIDPGYKGPMHLTVINMGKKEYDLTQGDLIVTVLFFELSYPVKSDYFDRNGNIAYGPMQRDINKLSVDFLDVERRAQEVAKKTILTAEFGLKVAVALLAIAVGLGAYYTPILNGI